MACRIAKVFKNTVQEKEVIIRIDSAEFGVEKWKDNPGEGTARIRHLRKPLLLQQIMVKGWQPRRFVGQNA